MSWYILAWKKAVDFSGRSRRKEYWYFQLFNILVFFIVFAAAILLDPSFSERGHQNNAGSVLITLYAIATILPAFAVTVRRLHDIGKSGWWYFISFVPLIGGIILLVFACTDSEAFANQWGLDPKAPERALIPPPFPYPR